MSIDPEIIDASLIHDSSVAHSMANAVHAEMAIVLLKNSHPNTNVEDVALTAGVVDLICNPYELASLVEGHLNNVSISDRGHELIVYNGVGPEKIGRIIAALAMTLGERTQTILSQKTNIIATSMSRGVSGLIADGYIDNNNGLKQARGRVVNHLTPTKKFARELAENPLWQRAVIVRKLAEKLGMSEEDALDYALLRTLEDNS